MTKSGQADPVVLLAEFRRKVSESETAAAHRLDEARTQDERYAIHAEHVKERIALTVELLNDLPLDIAEDQLEGLRKARDQHERDFRRTGKSYHQGNVELLARLIAAGESALQERRAAPSPVST